MAATLPDLPLDPDTVKGFMPQAEGAALLRAGLAAPAGAPFLEIGSYCGKSALWLGTAARQRDTVLFTVDHHRGSEETQPGWVHHDPDTWDAQVGAMDTLPFLRDTLRRADLEAHVLAVVGQSLTLARHWHTPLALLFIDGGHGRAVAHADYRAWTGHVMRDGLLVIHDVFEDPAQGGRPPFEIYSLARASGLFEDVAREGSLRVLRRL